jgi:hypothetical protein
LVERTESGDITFMATGWQARVETLPLFEQEGTVAV